MPFQKKSNKPKLKEKSAFGTQEKEWNKKTYSRFSRERIRDRKREILVTAKEAKENEKILSVKRKAELGN